jgi:hypothetical protein
MSGEELASGVVEGTWQAWIVSSDGQRVYPLSNWTTFESATAFCRGYLAKCNVSDFRDGEIALPFRVPKESILVAASIDDI